MESRNVIPAFGYSSLGILEIGKTVYSDSSWHIGSIGSKRKTSEESYHHDRRVAEPRAVSSLVKKGFHKTAEEESRNWSYRVYVYVVEFRLFSDLTYIRVRYICMCVVEFLSFRRWSIYWSCSDKFHAEIMPDLTVDKSHQNICTFLMCKIHQNSRLNLIIKISQINWQILNFRNLQIIRKIYTSWFQIT